MYIFISIILICLIIIIIIIVCSSKVQRKSKKLQNTSKNESKNESVYVFLYAQNEFNIKSHDILKYFKQNYIVFEKHITTVENTIHFIENNQQNEYFLLFYSCQRHLRYEYDIMSYLDTLTIFFTFDYWYRNDNPYNLLWMKRFVKKNFYITTFARSFEELKNTWASNIIIKNKNIIYDFNLWTCYDEASKVKFVKHPPNNLICVSGETNMYHYPERSVLIGLNNVQRMKYNINNNYVKNLSQYICAFYSSVYVQSTEGYKINTHAILLKLYEILASGSLLLCSSTEKKYIKQLGLIHKKNCWIADIETIQTDINYITNLKNKNEIDKIRWKGKQLSYQHTSEIKYNILMNRILSLKHI